MTMTNLPAPLVEHNAIEVIQYMFERMQEHLTADASRRMLRAYIREQIKKGAVPTMRVVEAADNGDTDCDLALRELIAEMVNNDELPPVLLRAYLQKALFRPPAPYQPGRYFLDTWNRDIGISILVSMTAEMFNLPISRNRASKRHSACSLVAEVLPRNGHNVGERQVERIHRERNEIGAKLSASIKL
jgi:hypothetical protein